MIFFPFFIIQKLLLLLSPLLKATTWPVTVYSLTAMASGTVHKNSLPFSAPKKICSLPVNLPTNSSPTTALFAITDIVPRAVKDRSLQFTTLSFSHLPTDSLFPNDKHHRTPLKYSCHQHHPRQCLNPPSLLMSTKFHDHSRLSLVMTNYSTTSCANIIGLC